MTGETMPGSGIVNIREYCERQVKGQPVTGITPPQVAAALADHARRTLELLDQMPEKITDKELRLTLGDLRAMAHLGNYYAEKILGATDLALYDKTGRDEQRQLAAKHLESALSHWHAYATVATRQYRPQLLTRIGYVDLNALTEQVRGDVQIAKTWRRR